MFNLFRKNKNKRCINNPLFFSYECKFCGCHSHVNEKLWKVCKCKGTLEWVHIKCLKEWQQYKYGDKNICEICGEKYIIPN